KAGKADEAEAALREGVRAIPRVEEMKHRLVMFFSEHRGIDAAEKEIRADMQMQPKNENFYFWLTDVYIAHNATDRAIALLQQISARNQEGRLDTNARGSLARIHFAKGEEEAAAGLAAGILKKDPGNRDALFIRAAIAFDKGLYRDSLTDLRNIVRNE